MKKFRCIRTVAGRIIDLDNPFPDVQNYRIKNNILWCTPKDSNEFVHSVSLGRIIARAETEQELIDFKMPADFMAFRFWCDMMEFNPSHADSLHIYVAQLKKENSEGGERR